MINRPELNHSPIPYQPPHALTQRGPINGARPPRALDRGVGSTGGRGRYLINAIRLPNVSLIAQSSNAVAHLAAPGPVGIGRRQSRCRAGFPCSRGQECGSRPVRRDAPGYRRGCRAKV